MFEKKDGEGFSGAVETIVGTSVKLKGNLKSDGDITIDGSVNGEIKTKGTVNIGPNAHVIANVKAKKVTIAGTVQGNIEATERLTIAETGRIYGDIIANVLSISPGAIFTGKSTMMEKVKPQEAEPIAEFDEPVVEPIEKDIKK